MPSASARAKSEDNYYRRAQLEELARQEFPDLKVFESDEGKEFFIGNPATASDELTEQLEALGQRQVDIARAHLDAHMGPDTYDDEFKAAGGQSWMIFLALKNETERQQGITPGAGTPTN